MNIEQALEERSSSQCELCSSKNNLTAYTVAPHTEPTPDTSIYACATCVTQIEDQEQVNINHWRCLNDSMWSTTPAVQVVAWRMLNRLRSEGWPQDLLDMMYLDEETLAWAKETMEDDNEEIVKHVDSNGVILTAGDTVILIKDLNVKGVSFIAKRGTAVRRISLVADNPEHIEGKVNGQQIVILTKFVKKSKQ